STQKIHECRQNIKASMELEIDAEAAEQTEYTSRGWPRSEGCCENSTLRRKEQKRIWPHARCVTLVGKTGQHKTLHTGHRQCLRDPGAGTSKGHERQRLR